VIRLNIPRYLDCGFRFNGYVGISMPVSFVFKGRGKGKTWLGRRASLVLCGPTKAMVYFLFSNQGESDG
jgi:hypothetical protein